MQPEATLLQMNGHERLKALSERMKREVDGGARPAPERLTVREFLGWFGYGRRGSSRVWRIRRMLSGLDLKTLPDFGSSWMDAPISIVLDPETVEDIAASDREVDPTVRIRMIDAANRKPTTVAPDSNLSAATTLMLTNDFSQLPVMSGKHSVKGVISWKSIGAKLSMGQKCEFVRDCMDPSFVEIRIGAPLFEAIADIEQHGYVLVRGTDNTITGIVTSADIGHQLTQLAGPFLLIGEIEGYLRILVHRKFTVEELSKVLPIFGDEHSVSGPEDLTFGGYCQLLGEEESWSRLDLDMDRKEFVKMLKWVNAKRNDIMHFDPDGLEPQDVTKLETVAKFFRNLRRMKII